MLYIGTNTRHWVTPPLQDTECIGLCCDSLEVRLSHIPLELLEFPPFVSDYIRPLSFSVSVCCCLTGGWSWVKTLRWNHMDITLHFSVLLLITFITHRLCPVLTILLLMMTACPLAVLYISLQAPYPIKIICQLAQ